MWRLMVNNCSLDEAIIQLETTLSENQEKLNEYYANKNFDKAEEIGYVCAVLSSGLEQLKKIRENRENRTS